MVIEITHIHSCGFGTSVTIRNMKVAGSVKLDDVFPIPLINVGKYCIFFKKKREYHLIINMVSGPIFSTGIVNIPMLRIDDFFPPGNSRVDKSFRRRHEKGKTGNSDDCRKCFFV